MKEENEKLKETLKSARNLLQVQGEMLQYLHANVCSRCQDLFKTEDEEATPQADHTIDFNDILEEYRQKNPEYKLEK